MSPENTIVVVNQEFMLPLLILTFYKTISRIKFWSDDMTSGINCPSPCLFLSQARTNRNERGMSFQTSCCICQVQNRWTGGVSGWRGQGKGLSGTSCSLKNLWPAWDTVTGPHFSKYSYTITLQYLNTSYWIIILLLLIDWSVDAHDFSWNYCIFRTVRCSSL